MHVRSGLSWGVERTGHVNDPGVTTNASFDGGPVRLDVQSGRLVLIDPLALDGLHDELTAVSAAPPSEQRTMLQALGAQGLRIGFEELSAFQPGVHQLDLEAFESVDARDSHPGVFEIDSGTVVVIDLSALSAVARALKWDRYDELLQRPVGDDSLLEEINADVGGARFAIISADAGRPFSGDGAFRLLTGRVARVPQ